MSITIEQIMYVFFCCKFNRSDIRRVNQVCSNANNFWLPCITLNVLFLQYKNKFDHPFMQINRFKIEIEGTFLIILTNSVTLQEVETFSPKRFSKMNKTMDLSEEWFLISFCSNGYRRMTLTSKRNKHDI